MGASAALTVVEWILGRSPGELNRIAESDGTEEPTRRVGGALARPPRTVLVTPTNPLTYPRGAARGNAGTRLERLVAGPKRGSACVTHYLRSGRGCVSSAIDRPLVPPTAAHWRERRVSVTQV